MPRVAQLPKLSAREARAAAKASRERSDGRPLLSVEDAASYLSVSRDTIYRLIREGELHSFSIGATLRIRPTDLDHYLDRKVAS